MACEDAQVNQALEAARAAHFGHVAGCRVGCDRNVYRCAEGLALFDAHVDAFQAQSRQFGVPWLGGPHRPRLASWAAGASTS